MTKKIIEAEILHNDEIAEGIYRLEIYAPEAAHAARPGQFINIYPKSDRLILPRPISISDAVASEGTLVIIYALVGEGTAELAGFERGELIKITTPLGNGFDLDAADGRGAAVLIGGGIGSAPMVFLAKKLAAAGVDCTAVAGFRREPFLIEELKAAGCRVIVTTDEPSEDAFLGTVVDCMDVNGVSGDIYFACGPKPMLAAVSSFVYGRDAGAELQVSMEERMGCGYGACVGCVCEIKVPAEDGGEPAEAAGAAGVDAGEAGDASEAGYRIVRKKVCKDGPVFKGSEVVW